MAMNLTGELAKAILSFSFHRLSVAELVGQPAKAILLTFVCCQTVPIPYNWLMALFQPDTFPFYEVSG